MTREEALLLEYGDELHHKRLRQGGGKIPLRVRVTGKVKTWKRDPNRIEIPVKHGLYESHTITESDLDEWDVPAHILERANSPAFMGRRKAEQEADAARRASKRRILKAAKEESQRRAEEARAEGIAQAKARALSRYSKDRPPRKRRLIEID